MLKHIDTGTEDDSGEGINISPLIDIVFILLLFFIVTSVFVRETGVEVRKPDAAQAEVLDPNSILIGITAAGTIHYGGEEIGLFGIVPTLRRLDLRPTQPVIIQADGSVPTSLLIAALDNVKAAGVRNVSVATQPK